MGPSPSNIETKTRIVFFNTYEPVIPFFELILPALAERGWDATAVVSRGIYREKSAEQEETASVQHVWVPRPLLRNKVAAAMAYYIQATFYVLFGRLDVAVFLSQPPLFYIVGALLCWLRGKRFVLHVMDLHPELLLESGHISPAANCVLHRLSDWARSRATLIVVPGRCMKERLVNSGGSTYTIELETNWPVPSLHSVPDSANDFVMSQGLSGEFVVLYSGNMGIPHEYRTILDVASQLAAVEDLLFLFVGGGRWQEVVRRAEAEGPGRIRCLTFQPRERLSHSLSAGHVHFISLRQGFEGLVVPSKFYAALAVGRPVIFEGSHKSEIARTITEYGCGQVVRSGDTKGLREAMLRYYEDPLERELDGVRARQAYETHFTPEVSTIRYCKLLSNLRRPTDDGPN